MIIPHAFILWVLNYIVYIKTKKYILYMETTYNNILLIWFYDTK